MEIRSIFDLRRFSTEKLEKVNLFSTPQFFLDLYCMEPGQKQKIHRHDDASKFYLVLEGHATIEVGDERSAIGPGQTVLAPAGETHGVQNDSQDRLVLLVGIAPAPTRA